MLFQYQNLFRIATYSKVFFMTEFFTVFAFDVVLYDECRQTHLQNRHSGHLTLCKLSTLNFRHCVPAIAQPL